MVKCPVCGKSELILEKRRSELYGFGLGEYMAEVCKACGKIFWFEDDVIQMEKRAKELAIWGLEHKTKVSVAGNSLIIRIPRKLAQFMGLDKGSEIVVHPYGKDKLIVEEITRRRK
jgi:hypothetical protein